jgi:hypothetical protein
VGPFVNYGYENEVLLPIPMQLGATFGDDRLLLAADVDWLVCKEECLPGQAHLSLPLPIRRALPTPDPGWSALFDAARRMLPRPPPAHWQLSGNLGQDAFHLVVHGVDGPVKAASFLPREGDYIEHAAAQRIKTAEHSVELRLQRSSRLVNEVAQIAGVLVLTTERESAQVYEAAFPLGGVGAGNLVLPVLLAFVGGFLLNLMPWKNINRAVGTAYNRPVRTRRPSPGLRTLTCDNDASSMTCSIQGSGSQPVHGVANSGGDIGGIDDADVGFTELDPGGDLPDVGLFRDEVG